MSFHAQIHACLSVRACKCTGVAAERLDMSNHRAWRCSMCKQLFDHQISKRSPLCRHLIGHGSTTQKNLVTCRDSALLSKRFVVRRLLKACRVAIADDTQSLEEVTNVFQLARLQSSELPTSVSSIFSFALGAADCHVTPQLIQKFGEDERRWQRKSKNTYVIARLACHCLRATRGGFTSSDSGQCDQQHHASASLVQQGSHTKATALSAA